MWDSVALPLSRTMFRKAVCLWNQNWQLKLTSRGTSPLRLSLGDLPQGPRLTDRKLISKGPVESVVLLSPSEKLLLTPAFLLTLCPLLSSSWPEAGTILSQTILVGLIPTHSKDTYDVVVSIVPVVWISIPVAMTMNYLAGWWAGLSLASPYISVELHSDSCKVRKSWFLMMFVPQRDPSWSLFLMRLSPRLCTKDGRKYNWSRRFCFAFMEIWGWFLSWNKEEIWL